MRKFLMALVCMALPFLSWAQQSEELELLAQINEKQWYFMELNGDVHLNSEGLLVMNGIAIDLPKTEVAYKETEDGQEAYLMLYSADGEKIYRFRENGQLLFETNNLLYPIRNKEQAAEMVVLFTMLKSLRMSAS